MSEPTVSEIIEKAKQLCRLDGMLWSKLDFQNPMAQHPYNSTAGRRGRSEEVSEAGADVARHGSPTSAPWKLEPLVTASHWSGRTIAQIAPRQNLGPDVRGGGRSGLARLGKDVGNHTHCHPGLAV